MIRILIVEDDKKLNKSVCTYLNNNGYQTVGCLEAQSAYDAMYQNTFDLIISDIMMPNIDGYEFAKTVRSLNQDIPILFMSARDDISAKQKGFRVGIDDYMVKPIDLEELILRIEALLRRAHIQNQQVICIGNFMMNADAMEVIINNEDMPLTTREFHILFKLLSYPNKTFSRSQLMDEFWGLESDTSLRAVDVYITKLRDKLSMCDGFCIKTIRGIGYKAVLIE